MSAYTDEAHEDYVVEEATLHNGWYDIRFREVGEEKGCMGFGLQASELEAAGVPAPKAGDALRMWGTFGRPIRGVMLNGRVVYYRTEAEQHEKDRADVERRERERRAEYEAEQRVALQRQIDTLPPEFQARIAKFRRNNPDGFWDFEGYEVSCCVDAQHIIANYTDPDDIRAFGKLDYHQQRALIPAISDGHSGNSFGMVVRLAWLYRKNPALVEQEHGALCPLVGCKDYGCFSPSELAAMSADVSL